MSITLDKFDVMILANLREDAKVPIKELAKKIGIHPNTLLQRMEKLKKSGYIKKIVAEIDYPKVGLDLHVIIQIRVKRGRAGDSTQLKELLKIKELESVYAVTGNWDLTAVCRVQNRDHLLEVIQKIGDLPIVTKTSSQLVLYTYKNPSDYNPFKE